MQHLNVIKVNEHLLIATPRRSVADVGEAAINEMARNRLLPAFGRPPYRRWDVPMIERYSLNIGEGPAQLGRIKYALPFPLKDDDRGKPPTFHVNITDHVIPMLEELVRAVRENLKHYA